MLAYFACRNYHLYICVHWLLGFFSLLVVSLGDQRKAVDLSRRCGQWQRSRQIYDFCRTFRIDKTFLRRDDVLHLITHCPLSSVNGLRPSVTSSLESEGEEAAGYNPCPAACAVTSSSDVHPSSVGSFRIRQPARRCGSFSEEDILEQLTIAPRKRHHSEDDDMVCDISPKRSRS